MQLLSQQKPRSVTMLLQSLLHAGQQATEPRPTLPPKSTIPICSIASPTKNAAVISKTAPAPLTPDDELFLVIDNDRKFAATLHRDEHDRSADAVHVEYRQYCLNKKLDMAIAAAKATRVSGMSTSTMHTVGPDTTPPRRSISRKLEFDVHRQNSFNKRLIKYLSENIRQRHDHRIGMTPSARNINGTAAIHNEIDGIVAEIRALVDLEEELVKVYTDKCERYRMHNNKYKTKLRLELCVDEVQRTLEVYAKKIIDTELQLYRIQNDIHDKCSRLYVLQNAISDNGNGEQIRSKYAHENSVKCLDDTKFNDSGAIVDSIIDKTFII